VGLYDSLTMAARSLQTQQYAMGVTGQNIANVNTPGYTRRVVSFAAVPPSHGGGVEVQDVHAARDTLLEGRLLQQVPVGSREAAVAEVLGLVETGIGAPGQALDARLDAFFSAYADLAESPTSPVARRQVQEAGTALAESFNQNLDRLEQVRQDADGRVRAVVDEVNDLTARVAEINGAMPAARLDGTQAALEDEQATLLRRLSELAGVHSIARQEGGVDLTVGNGRPLVVGANTYRLDLASAPGTGYATLRSQGEAIDGKLAGGRLGGLLHARDTLVTGYQSQLDTLASQTATQVNTLHAAGYGLAGTSGADFFSYSSVPSGTAGAAKALRVDPGIVNDNGTIAAGSVAVAGDNTAARQIAGLRDERVLNGNTATLGDGWGSLVYQIGNDSRKASDAADTQAQIVLQMDAMRDQVSGVSLDEEALNLLKFQRAYEANARFFSAVDDMLLTLMNAVGR
jgi:flagellar hook-associated protein 1 FlgK